MKKYLSIFVLTAIPFCSFATEVNFKRVVEIALEKSKEIKLSKKNVEQSYANVAIEKSGFLPDINIVGDINRNKTGETTQNNRSFGLGLKYNIFNGGKTMNKVGIAKNNTEKATIQHKKNVASVLISVAKVYYGVKKSRLLQKSYKSALDNTNQIMDIEKIRFNSGAVDKTLYLNAQSSYYNSKAKLVDIKTILSALNTQYYNITGTDLPQNLPNPDLSALEIIKTMDEAIKKARANNLDVQIAKIQLENADSDYYIALAEHSPQLNVNASVKRNTTLENNTVSFGLNYSMPLFSGGRDMAKTTRGKILQKQAEIAYRKAKDDAEVAAINAWSKYLSSKEELSSYEKSLASLKMSLEMEQLRYKNGTTESTSLLDIQNKKLVAEQMYISSYEKVAISILDLLIVTGELSLEKLENIK